MKDGGDEINRPERGKNYGWPVISYGTEYSGGKIGTGTRQAGMEQPVFYWDPSIAPSGMMIYSGKLWPCILGHSLLNLFGLSADLLWLWNGRPLY